MTHVLDVLNGTMMLFELKFAFERVCHLKAAIEKRLDIPQSEQILLISGGISLGPNDQISFLGTGTYTNPVFFFNSKGKTGHLALDSASDTERMEARLNKLKLLVEESNRLPLDYDSMLVRNNIVERFFKEAEKVRDLCDALVKEHHLLHQGWFAAVAHLEELVSACDKNSQKLRQNVENYVANSQSYAEILTYFNKDLETLSKIPLIPLIEKSLSQSHSSITDNALVKIDDGMNFHLGNWISEPRLKKMFDYCSKSLNMVNEKILVSINQEMEAVLQTAGDPNLKTFDNISETLHKMEEVMVEAKALYREQKLTAESFNRVKPGLRNERDPEVLAVKCVSDKDYIIMMWDYHELLHKKWTVCRESKRKLTADIVSKFQKILEVVSNVVAINDKVALYNDSLNRLSSKFNSLNQAHVISELYVRAIVETVRRKYYSKTFLDWAEKLVTFVNMLCSKEISRRREFERKFKGHFLNEVFTGLEDSPEPLVTAGPSKFDDRIPDLNIVDVEFIKERIPEGLLNIDTSLFDVSATGNDFFERFAIKGINESEEEISSDNLGIQCLCAAIEGDNENCKGHGKGCESASVETLSQKTESDNSVEKAEKMKLVPFRRNRFNLTEVIQSFDDEFKARVLDRCSKYQLENPIVEEEVVDYMAIIYEHEEIIANLKYRIREDKYVPGKQDLVVEHQKKLACEQSLVRRLKSLCRSMKTRQQHIKVCEETVTKISGELNRFDEMFEQCAEAYDKKIKELS